MTLIATEIDMTKATRMECRDRSNGSAAIPSVAPDFPKDITSAVSPEVNAAWIAFRNQHVLCLEWPRDPEGKDEDEFNAAVDVECELEQDLCDIPARTVADAAVKLLAGLMGEGGRPGCSEMIYNASLPVAVDDLFRLIGTDGVDWGDSQTMAKWRTALEAGGGIMNDSPHTTNPSTRLSFEAKHTQALATMGDISQATIWQLRSLYKGLSAVEHAYLSTFNMPATGCDEGEHSQPIEGFLTEEMDRVYYFMKVIFEELASRPIQSGLTENDRLLILVDWTYHKGLDFPDDHAEAIAGALENAAFQARQCNKLQ